MIDDVIGLTPKGEFFAASLVKKVWDGFELDFLELGVLSVFLFCFKDDTKESLIRSGMAPWVAELVSCSLSYLRSGGC